MEKERYHIFYVSHEYSDDGGYIAHEAFDTRDAAEAWLTETDNQRRDVVVIRGTQQKVAKAHAQIEDA